MYTFYENQHPDHTERRRQALRDTAAQHRAVRRSRHAGDDVHQDVFLPVAQRRRLLAEIAAARTRANEIHVDPLGEWRGDPLSPRRPGQPLWYDAMRGTAAWALTVVLLIAVVMVSGVWP